MAAATLTPPTPARLLCRGAIIIEESCIQGGFAHCCALLPPTSLLGIVPPKSRLIAAHPRHSFPQELTAVPFLPPRRAVRLCVSRVRTACSAALSCDCPSSPAAPHLESCALSAYCPPAWLPQHCPCAPQCTAVVHCLHYLLPYYRRKPNAQECPALGGGSAVHL